MNKKIRTILPFVILFLGIIGAFIIVRSRPKIEKKEVTFPPPLVRSQIIQLQDAQLIVNSPGTVSPGPRASFFLKSPDR
jgi:hypothetical protein